MSTVHQLIPDVMRIISLNVNGLRSAALKGFFGWLAEQDADLVCLQEIRIQSPQLANPVFHPPGFHCVYFPALKKGYSGVAVLSRLPPDEVIRGIGWTAFDNEGRYLEVRVANLSVVSLYLPSGSSGPERQAVKFEVMERLLPHLRTCHDSGRDYVLCGDWNIAHKPIDLKKWRSNLKNSGFLPEERAWMDRLLDDEGWVDGFRVINQAAGEYTWWSNRGLARVNNTGWRIDYQMVTPSLSACIRQASIYRDERFSDHAPLTLDYDYPLPA